MNTIGNRIRKIRDEKGISQLAMAEELKLTQSNYGRLEKDDNRLTVPKLTKIAEILNISISSIFNEKISQVISQNNNENPSAYNVENLFQDTKGIYDKYILSLTAEIEHLKDEVHFLRNMKSK